MFYSQCLTARNALSSVTEDVQILLVDNFDSELVFYGAMIEDIRCHLYKLKCLKIRFNLWKNGSQISWNYIFHLFCLRRVGLLLRSILLKCHR